MSPMQQIFLGLGAVAKKTFVDDVFSTNVYTGAGNGQVINNGIDNSSEGGMVWFKRRDGTYDHQIVDTIRGGNKGIRPNLSSAEITTTYISSFNNNGYTLGTENAASQSGLSFAAWNFRKAPGFFDFVTYTGNGSARTIAHSLGSVPGMIMVKRTDSASDWIVYHRSSGYESNVDGSSRFLTLNENFAAATSNGAFGGTEPTASVFSLGTFSTVNASGATYVAYLFAGGESTAATARSVSFDGNGRYLSIPTSSDLAFGTGDFTIEFWQRLDSSSNSPHQLDFRVDGSNTGTNNSLVIYTDNSSKLHFFLNGSIRISARNSTVFGQWDHVALVRNSSTTTLYINGISQGTYSDTTNYGSSSSNSNPLVIGQRQGNYASNSWDGEISNLRIVKGTAVYTSSFRPPTEPLTNITNTKLLCCNNSSTTGSTVTPGTITASGGPTASIDSPFDDPAGFKFGDSGTENIIKCGSYEGNGTTQHIDIGFEAQWVLIKNIDTARDWMIADSMRGAANIPFSNAEKALFPNDSSDEVPGNYVGMYERGFRLLGGENVSNTSGDTYVYVACRRPDGYVGKPPELGTDVFNLALGAGNGSIPEFAANFAVDLGIVRQFASTQNFYVASRLTGTKYLQTNNTAAEASASTFVFDSNAGWDSNSNNTNISWMWKRHAGFDCITYKGSGSSAGEQQDVPHSMNKIPEMMWIKIRDYANQDWMIYHKDLNGGTNPEQYKVNFSINSESTFNYLNNTAPTATSFRVGNAVETNHSSYNYIAMLFASISGISTVGSYTGTGSQITITTGFQPRFIIIKRIDYASPTNYYGDWYVYDTLRDLSGSFGGSTQRLMLNSNSAQYGCGTCVAIFANGFYVGTSPRHNTSNAKYIYYAHA